MQLILLKLANAGVCCGGVSQGALGVDVYRALKGRCCLLDVQTLLFGLTSRPEIDFAISLSLQDIINFIFSAEFDRREVEVFIRQLRGRRSILHIARDFHRLDSRVSDL